MTFPPFFNTLAPRQTTGTSLGGSTATQRLLFANALRQQQQQQSMLISPSMANTISRLLPTATAVSEPRSATPDPLPEETIEYDEYDHDQDDTEADSVEDQEVRDGPSHCRHHQEQQHETIAAAAATSTTTTTSTSTISDDEDNAALMLLGLSKIVSKEISTDARCMVPRQGHEQLRDNPSASAGTAVQHVASVPKSIEIDTRHWEGSCSSSRASPTKNNTQGLSPVVVVSSNGKHSSLASLSPPRIINQPRYRTVSLTGDEILSGRNSGNGNNTKAVHELSPLLLPLSSPRATTEEFNNSTPSFFLRESPPPKVNHKPRFRYTTTNWEEQQQQRVIEAFRNDAKALEEVVVAATVASHIITPIPQQPRPVLSFATATQKSAASAAAAVAASKTRVVVTHRGPTTEMVPDAAGGSDGHSPLELPPLLPTPKTKANAQETTEGNIYDKPPPQLIAPTKQQLISYNKDNKDIEAMIATRQKNANTLAAANKRRNQNQPPASRSCAKVSRRSAAAAKSKASSNSKNQSVHGPRSKKKNTTATTKKPQRQRQSGKKFSWKAYPELESFLIVNREEYLSFSARNYTIEQRDYNNRLTSRLLEHANTSGYSTLFESCAFSAVRDRIRSYYKSYVQSFKRRKERQQQQERLKQLEMDCSN